MPPHFLIQPETPLIHRVCVIGGESTGKTTLAEELANYFGTNFVSEFARFYLEEHRSVTTVEEMSLIAQEQARREDAAQHLASRYLFCDTNAVLTKIWSEKYFGECPATVHTLIRERSYSLYLLLHPDIPWVDDGMRDSPDDREWFLQTIRQDLCALGCSFREISGTGSNRLNSAIAAVKLFFSVGGDGQRQEISTEIAESPKNVGLPIGDLGILSSLYGALFDK